MQMRVPSPPVRQASRPSNYTCPLPSTMRERIEYWLVLCVASTLGWMPRRLARLCGAALAWGACRALGRLRRVGMRNLEIALPTLSAADRDRILRGVFRHLGWQLVEFCRMTRYTRENTRGWIRPTAWDITGRRMPAAKACWC